MHLFHYQQHPPTPNPTFGQVPLSRIKCVAELLSLASSVPFLYSFQCYNNRQIAYNNYPHCLVALSCFRSVFDVQTRNTDLKFAEKLASGILCLGFGLMLGLCPGWFLYLVGVLNQCRCVRQEGERGNPIHFGPIIMTLLGIVKHETMTKAHFALCYFVKSTEEPPHTP